MDSWASARKQREAFKYDSPIKDPHSPDATDVSFDFLCERIEEENEISKHSMLSFVWFSFW